MKVQKCEGVEVFISDPTQNFPHSNVPSPPSQACDRHLDLAGRAQRHWPTHQPLRLLLCEGRGRGIGGRSGSVSPLPASLSTSFPSASTASRLRPTSFPLLLLLKLLLLQELHERRDRGSRWLLKSGHWRRQGIVTQRRGAGVPAGELGATWGNAGGARAKVT